MNLRIKNKLFSAKHVFLVFGSTAVKVFMAHSCLFTNADEESGHVVGLWVTWPVWMVPFFVVVPSLWNVFCVGVDC